MNQRKVWDRIAEEKIIKKLENLLIKSIRKSVPKKRIGLLLSGGIDSSILALILKKLKYDFVCYTAEFCHPDFKKADDVKYAKLLAKNLEIPLKVIKVNLKETEKVLSKIIKIIGSDEVTMVSIALSHYFCLKKAYDEGIKTVLYDCVNDCIFAGLHKHKISKDINQTCVDSLNNTYKIDFPRDKAIAKHFGINLKSPFLDKELIAFGLALPSKYKVYQGVEKYILRKTALKMGLPRSIALRKKRSVQYSSNSQKMIKKISRQKGFSKMYDYLHSLNLTCKVL